MKNLLNYSNQEICDLLSIDIDKVKKLKKIIRCEDSQYLINKYKSVNSWVNQCFNLPRINELKTCAINELLTGYGVESISNDYIYINSYYMNICATYINFGDTYINTILFDHLTEKFTIISYGDYYEKYIQKYDTIEIN